MKRYALTFVAVLAASVSLAASTPLAAQQHRERVLRSRTAAVTGPGGQDALGIPAWAREVAAPARPRQPRKAPYLLGGALLGGAAVGLGILATLNDGGECICSPIMFAPFVAGGMALGVGAGYVVYRIRFR